LTKIKYAGHLSNPLVHAACQQIESLGGLIHPLQGIEPAPNDSFVICSSYGNFPGIFIREVKLADKEKRGIETPEFARYAKGTFALDANRSDQILTHHPEFCIAVQQMHFRLIALFPEQPVKRPKPRWEWTGGFHAWVRAERARDETFCPFD
jgi:hypothetical protein